MPINLHCIRHHQYYQMQLLRFNIGQKKCSRQLPILFTIVFLSYGFGFHSWMCAQWIHFERVSIRQMPSMERKSFKIEFIRCNPLNLYDVNIFCSQKSTINENQQNTFHFNFNLIEAKLFRIERPIHILSWRKVSSINHIIHIDSNILVTCLRCKNVGF